MRETYAMRLVFFRLGLSLPGQVRFRTLSQALSAKVRFLNLSQLAVAD